MCKKCESRWPVFTSELSRLFKIRDSLKFLIAQDFNLLNNSVSIEGELSIIEGKIRQYSELK